MRLTGPTMADRLRHVFSAFSIFVLASCGELTRHDPILAHGPIDGRIGWLHGNCLAIRNPDLSSNITIVVAVLAEPVRYRRAKVIGPASEAESCPALMDDRRRVNVENGYSFYQTSDIARLDLGVGFLDLDAKARTYDVVYCTTAEGVRFSVRDHDSLVWTGYYYLGYDTEVTCETESTD